MYGSRRVLSHRMRMKLIAVAAPLATAFCIAAYFLVLIQPSLVHAGARSVWTDYDYQSYFLPRFVAGSRWLLHGQLPVWNPYEFGGIPFLATGQPAVFYPPKILLYGLLSPVTAHWTFLVVHYLALAGAFLLFLRNRGITGVPAFVGVAVWAFSVLLLTSNYHPNRIGSLAWMPLMFLLADRLGSGRWKAFAGLAFVVAVMLTAGYPMLAVDIGLLLGVHAIACFAFGEWEGAPWKTVPLLGAAFLLGAIAAAAQLLPLVELSSIARRTDFAAASNTIDLPDLPTPLLSMIPALMVFIAIGIPLKRARPAVANLVVCVFLAKGGWKVIGALPLFSMSRFPFTWAFLLMFFTGWTAAIGCDALLKNELIGSERRLALTAIVAASAVLTVAYIAASVDAGRLLAHVHSLSGFKYNVNNRFSAALGVAACLSLIGIAVRDCRAHVRWTAWLAACLLAVLSHLAAAPFAATPAPFARPTKTGVVDRLFGHRGAAEGRAISLSDLRYGYEITDAIPSPFGVEVSFLPDAYRQIGDRLGLLVLYDTMTWPATVRASGFLDAMDVNLVVVPDTAARLFAAHGYRRVRHVRPTSVMQNRRRIGQAWVNYSVHRVNSRREALDYVLGDQFDPHREVVIEEPLSRDYPVRTEDSVTVARAEIGNDPERVGFKVDLPKPGILVVSESAYPGWYATLDGKPTRWVTADFVLRAVEVPPGRHVVRFTYQPRSVRRGLWISALGLFAILALYLSRVSLPWAKVPKGGGRRTDG